MKMINNKIDSTREKIEFIKNLKEQYRHEDHIELCKKFIKANWSNNENLGGRAQEIHSNLAKRVVGKLFGPYISDESFILAAYELGYKFSLIDGKKVFIKYRVHYEQNVG